MDQAVFAGGCFWCTEAIFERLRGVTEVVSGYAGGKIENPSYDDIHGVADHAESIQITFDPKEISYEELLYVFFHTHNPTQADGQGNDKGPEYRSMILYFDEEQKIEAQKALEETQKEYSEKIVTQVRKLEKFYPAEGHHQDYYQNNKNQTYCKLVIDPKIKKLEIKFKKYLR
jgi:peptide-methionine (S)-S-oxide reductase